jgi:Flp pilus assembly pilin Flp
MRGIRRPARGGDAQPDLAIGGAATPSSTGGCFSVARVPVAANSSDISAAGILARENGQTMAEYAVVLAVITPLLVVILTLLGTNIAVEITKIASWITF